MMSRFCSVALVCLMAALITTPIAAEDLTVVSQVTATKTSPTTSTQYITADKVRTGDGRYDTIVDLTSGDMIHIDHKKKRYYETTLEELHQHFAEFASMLDDNPMLANMLGKATEVTVTKGSEQRTIAGYSCQQYSMTMGDNFQFEIWAADGLQAPAQYYDARKMAYATMGPVASRFEKMYDEMKKIDGFPLATEFNSRMMGMNLEGTSEATEVRKGPISADVFEPPAGYKKKKSPYK